MKEIKKLIERKTKELKELEIRFNNTPVENKGALERLDMRIQKLRYYIMGLEDALLYLEMK